MSNHNFRRFWSLRNKILLSMTGLILVFALSTALIIRTILFGVLKTEFQQRGLSSAKSIAANSVVDVLTENTSRLKALLDNEKKLSPDTAYVFIIDSSGRVLTHTFENGFPVDLLKVNSLAKGKDSDIQLLDTQPGIIYDIAVPILLDNSSIGQVRLGILQKGIQKTLTLIDAVIVIVTLLVIMITVLLANKISALITSSISKLVEAVQSIQQGDFSARITATARDEIGFLANAFNQMAAHLKQLIGQKEQFTKYNERKKIALDLHDNCAQDLANLIKRLELCEKLFSIEPAKAFAEIQALKDNIRDHLGKTRQIIQGLKSPEEESFVLLEEIKGYLADYQRYSGIKIRLDTSGFMHQDIAPEKSRNIYYIITEALINIRKHAKAQNVELKLENKQPGELSIKIQDDGKGFDVNQAQISGSSSGKWGLTGMRERVLSLGGTISIGSLADQGTEISLKIPLGAVEYNI